MKPVIAIAALVAATAVTPECSLAGQGIPVSHRDRVYAAEQFSNTVSVTDPADNRLVGVIRLGDPAPGNFSPLYRGQALVHGLGFSPDHRTIVVVSIGSNSVTFIETATNAVKHITYVGRSPHEAFFTPDGSEVWVTVRGENYVAVLDAHTYEEKTRIIVPGGPGMQIFSPDGQYGYVCSSFTPETVVITVKDHQIVGRIPQGDSVLPQHRRHSGRWGGLVHAEGRRQDHGLQRAPAVRGAEDPCDRTDHEPREDRAQFERHVRVRDRRGLEPGPGLPHRRFLQGDDDPGREAAPWGVGIGRRHPGLRGIGERRPTDRHQHPDQSGGRDDSDRASAAGGDLRVRRRSDRAGHRRSPTPRRRRRGGPHYTRGARRRRAHERVAVRSGTHSGAAGRGDRAQAR